MLTQHGLSLPIHSPIDLSLNIHRVWIRVFPPAHISYEEIDSKETEENPWRLLEKTVKKKIVAAALPEFCGGYDIPAAIAFLCARMEKL